MFELDHFCEFGERTSCAEMDTATAETQLEVLEQRLAFWESFQKRS